MKAALDQLSREVARRKRRQVNRFAKYQTNPVGFIETETLGFVWSKQREICQSVVDNRFTAVKACHGPGKTAIAARIACWWLSVWPPGEAMVVSTAPTGHQVRTLLWREIGKVHRAAGLPGRCNQTEWVMGLNEIVGFGVAVRDTDPTRFQGIHSPHLLVILDEACGVTKAIHDAAETLVTNEAARFLEIGNPDDPSTQFATNCKPGSGYNVITISAFDTPNFTDEDIPDWLRRSLVDKVWVEERRRRWGETSPMYISKVLGEFPDVSSDGLIPIGALQEAVNRVLDVGLAPVSELGVDVARFGDDKTTFYHRLGGYVRRVGELRKRDTMEVAGRAVKLAKMLGVSAIKIDDTGLGGGVTDRLNELRFEGKIDCKIVPVIVGQSPTSDAEEERYYRLRDQLHWNMRERFIAGNISLMPAVDLIQSGETPVEGLDDLLAQAGAIKYKLTSRGQVSVESKDDMKKRGLPSPDDFDGMTLAFASPELGGEMVLPFQRHEVVVEPIRVPRFWPQVVVLHIDANKFAALWCAVHSAKDVLYITEEYIAPLGEMAVHADAVERRSRTIDGRKWKIPVVIALKTDQRSKEEGIRLAQRLDELGLDVRTVESAPLPNGIPDMVARMNGQRLRCFSNCATWISELQNFRRDANGDILEGSVPAMHATSLLVQSAMHAGESESAHDTEEDDMDDREAGRRRTANPRTGY